MFRLGPRYWFEWMALVLMGLALLLFFQGALFPDPAPVPGEPPQGGILWTLFLKGIGLVVGGFSVLLLLVRPLLSLRLWYSWVGMLAGGAMSTGGAADLVLFEFCLLCRPIASWAPASARPERGDAIFPQQ